MKYQYLQCKKPRQVSVSIESVVLGDLFRDDRLAPVPLRGAARRRIGHSLRRDERF